MGGIEYSKKYKKYNSIQLCQVRKKRERESETKVLNKIRCIVLDKVDMIKFLSVPVLCRSVLAEIKIQKKKIK